MRPETSEDRPSYLADDEPDVPTSHQPLVLGGTLEPDQDELEAEPAKSFLESISPITLFAVAISVGVAGAVGAAVYTTMNQPEPTMYEDVEVGPANEAGSVPVHKGIRKSTDRFGR